MILSIVIVEDVLSFLIMICILVDAVVDIVVVVIEYVFSNDVACC